MSLIENLNNIKHIELADLQEMHKLYFSPANMEFQISGHISKNEAICSISSFIQGKSNKKVKLPQIKIPKN